MFCIGTFPLRASGAPSRYRGPTLKRGWKASGGRQREWREPARKGRRRMPEGGPTPRVGDAFNPWRRFKGVMISDQVLASDLSLGAKVCYGVLARFAGERGKCFPTMQTIGARIGVSDRQAKSYIAELAREGYIRRARGGSGRPNRYHFLWHPSFDATDGKLPSRMTGTILPTEETVPRENPDLDLAPHRKDGDAPPESISGPSPDGWKPLSDLVEGLIERRPCRSSLGRIVAATPGKAGAEAVEAIQEAVQRGYGAESERGPRSVSWFVSVVRNYWADRQRRALPPAATNDGMDAAEFNRMVAAIEMPGAA